MNVMMVISISLIAIALILVVLIKIRADMAKEFVNPFQQVQKIESKYLLNFHKINEQLYRSGQPGKMGMRELENLGIKTILNLRPN